MSGEATVGAPRIRRVSGALVEVDDLGSASLNEIVYIGPARLLGEVVRVSGDRAIVQVYEETTGLRTGETVERTGRPLEVELGPGLLGSVLDGTGRPLQVLAGATGPFIRPGASARTLDATKAWPFVAERTVGDEVQGGDRLGRIDAATGIESFILVPPDKSGVIGELRDGEYTIDQPIGRLVDGSPLRLAHVWPVRRPRPVRRRLPGDRPFITGQRILDFLFPVAEGGAVSLPGGFGTGKTVVEQSLAKHGIADVVIYIGCGERGNEMAEVLSEFPALVDPRTGRSIMERTVLIANTSNMPVAAREASIHLGLTIGEYFRDMGCRVAVLADSISRWAEALREIGARLQEMPGEEGYPTHMGSRLACVFERAGRVDAIGSPRRSGALTLISAVSPPGGDLSEPVTQASLRAAGALWALDAALAHKRHFPAIDWESSYSLYIDATAGWFRENAGEDWPELRRHALALLQQERELAEIAGLIGTDALQDRERFVLAAARLLRESVLAQSAFDEIDCVSSPRKTRALAVAALEYADAGLEAVGRGSRYEDLGIDKARSGLRALRQATEQSVDEVLAGFRSGLETLRGAAPPVVPVESVPPVAWAQPVPRGALDGAR
jgi:V/A-type H+/Na+-transporting ATPase subunit A